MLLNFLVTSFLISVLFLLPAGAIEPDDVEVVEFVKSALVGIK